MSLRAAGLLELSAMHAKTTLRDSSESLLDDVEGDEMSPEVLENQETAISLIRRREMQRDERESETQGQMNEFLVHPQYADEIGQENESGLIRGHGVALADVLEGTENVNGADIEAERDVDAEMTMDSESYGAEERLAAAVEEVQNAEEGEWYETALLDPIGGLLAFSLCSEASLPGDALAG